MLETYIQVKKLNSNTPHYKNLAEMGLQEEYNALGLEANISV